MTDNQTIGVSETEGKIKSINTAAKVGPFQFIYNPGGDFGSTLYFDDGGPSGSTQIPFSQLQAGLHCALTVTGNPNSATQNYTVTITSIGGGNVLFTKSGTFDGSTSSFSISDTTLGYAYFNNLSIVSEPTSKPLITSQPQPMLTNAYNGATFTISASGTPPLSYQWELNGSNITGATSATLTVTNIKQADLGQYSAIVTNAFGTAISSNATLEMFPFLAVPFRGAITYWGESVTFNVQGWGTGPLSYQWYDNGKAILNATNQTLSFSGIQFTNAGLYSVLVSSSLGIATNIPEQVVVNPAGVSLGFSPTLTITGIVGATYIIQSSSNLENSNSWVSLTNMTLTQPAEIWVDTQVDASSPFNSQRFYKVILGQ